VSYISTRYLWKLTGLQTSLSDIEKASKEGTEPSTLEPQFHQLKNVFKEVKDFANAGSLHLPPFDQRNMQNKLSSFFDDMNATQSRLVPRKKFGFKRKDKKKAPAASSVSAAEAGSRHSTSEASVVADPSQAATNATTATKVEYDPERTLLGRKGETIVLDKHTLAGGDVFIKECEDCTIFLCGSMGALRTEQIRNCVIMTGPITGGCLMEGATDCVFHMAAHQMRLHHSHGCDYYLQMRSTPIIEDCSTLRFAPYALEYPELPLELDEADLSATACGENWSNVQDFKWLRQQQSPNWCILPEVERIVPAPPA